MARIMEDAKSSGEGRSSGKDGFSSTTGCCLGTVVSGEASAAVESDASFSGSDDDEKSIALYCPLDTARPCASFAAMILAAVVTCTLRLECGTKPRHCAITTKWIVAIVTKHLMLIEYVILLDDTDGRIRFSYCP
jgi:hypothetical protein